MNWRQVINQELGWIGPYAKGFDRNRKYEFKRLPEDKSMGAFKLADAGPHFNVAGLWFREPPQ